MSHSAQYFETKWANLLMAQEKVDTSNQTACCLLEAGLVPDKVVRGLLPVFHSAGIRNRFAFQWKAPCQGHCPHGITDMLRADLMKRDLLSEIVLGNKRCGAGCVTRYCRNSAHRILGE